MEWILEELGQVLSNHGYEVVVADAMGHGYSEGPLRKSVLNTKVQAENGMVEKDVTYWTGVKDVQKDLVKLCEVEKKKRKTKDLPVFLVGESLGALLTVPLAIEKNEFVDSIITTGVFFV